MKKQVFTFILVLFYSFTFSQDNRKKCLDISVLKPFKELTKEEKLYITNYLDKSLIKKSLYHPIKKINFNKGCGFPKNYKKIRFCLELLKLKKESKLIIESNTDSLEFKNNPKISLKRAKLVKEIFIHYGISSNRISIIDNQDKYPMSSNKTEKSRKYNRFIEFSIPNYL